MFEISLEVLVFVAFLVAVSIYSAKSSAERSRERERTAERNTIAAQNRAYDAGMRLAMEHLRLSRSMPHVETERQNRDRAEADGPVEKG